MSETDRGSWESAATDLVREKFVAELRDAVSVRTFLLVFGVLLLQLGASASSLAAALDGSPPFTPQHPLDVVPFSPFQPFSGRRSHVTSPP